MSAQARDLTFEDRVKAQEAIERVYYSHQIGATKPFEEAVPRAVLEGKVVKYLKQSVALEQYWHTPVTAEMLQRELERMARGTRLPDRLRELFAALDDDPVLIQECLARATLVDRLSRNFFAFDSRYHATAREEADALHAALADGTLDPWRDHPRRTEVEWVRAKGDGQSELDLTLSGDLRPGQAAAKRPERTLSPVEFDRLRSRLSDTPGKVPEVQDHRDAFEIRFVLQNEDTRVRLGVYRIQKTSWDEWWNATSDGLNADGVVAVAPSDASLSDEIAASDRGSWDPTRIAESDEWTVGTSYEVAGSVDDMWDNGSLDDTIEPRSRHTAVWTGSLMVVWGGYDDRYLNSGGRYDPATDTWTATTTAGAPSGRADHTAVWTGSRMVVWGGSDDRYLNTGGRYDPATDTWTATTTTNAPWARCRHTAVWTGSLMVVWGGNGSFSWQNTGGRYDPATDAWTPTTTTGAPSPRADHTAVWTGSLMVVWGGTSTTTDFNTGGRYDPATDTWAATTTTGAPSARFLHTAVWTGSLMVVWGDDIESTGGRYDPATDTWTPTTTTNAPSARNDHTAVWTGSRMVVWGGWGVYPDYYPITGGQYDPATDTWTPTTTTNAPWARYRHTAVWTGSLMVVWGGLGGANTGGRYDPTADTWTPTAFIAPWARVGHTAVWTGSLMVVWGGPYDDDSGGRYDPATDTWTETTTTGAPSGRSDHTAVWTGSLMVVWGGSSYYDDIRLRTGGRYDPGTDTWTETTTTGAPSGRYYHTAVWTGSLMVVWGGCDEPETYEMNYLNTGGRYDPATDTWTQTTTKGAPLGRSDHTAVWTGSRMVVWGGPYDDDSGGRYDPATDTWTETTTTGAPLARYWHKAVWTGGLMVVWGGSNGPYNLNTGGRYDPATNIWTATTTTGAPSARYWHTAVWTGRLMVVWGGYDEIISYLNTGGRYDPATNTWTATTTTNAPARRYYHTAVWTGSRMVVWGGRGESHTYLDSGGAYVVTSDDDWDGYSEADGDCDDGNSSVYPNAPEICDGFDNQCPGDPGYGQIDEGCSSDDDGDGYSESDGDCDDGNPAVYPNAQEICDGFDNQCPDYCGQGQIDEGCLEDWVQANEGGFGNPASGGTRPGVVFGDYLYVGVSNDQTGGEVWRTRGIGGPPFTDWERVNTPGFGDSANEDVVLHAFGTYIYACTRNEVTGCEVWRSQAIGVPPFTDWELVSAPGLGDRENESCNLSDFELYLYAGTSNSVTGGQVWRTQGVGGPPFTDWEQVNDSGFGDPASFETFPSLVFNDWLYVDVTNGVTGCQVWRTRAQGMAPFGDWELVNEDGFGDPSGGDCELAAFGGRLYVGTGGSGGSEVWRTAAVGSGPFADWEQVNQDGFGSPGDRGVACLAAFGDFLYVGTESETCGGAVWRTAAVETAPFSDWRQVDKGGFGVTANNKVVSFVPFGGRIYAGTENDTGGQVWRVNKCEIFVSRVVGTTFLFFTADSSPFDVVVGYLSDLRADGGFSQATCLGTFTESPVPDTLPEPQAGEGRYYLASCGGDIGYGPSSLLPDPRRALDLGPCP